MHVLIETAVNDMLKLEAEKRELDELRAVIITAAHIHKRPITYKELCHLMNKVADTKYTPRSRNLAENLGKLLLRDDELERTLASALVVNGTTKKPGQGFFETMGYPLVTHSDYRQADDFWAEELDRFNLDG